MNWVTCFCRFPLWWILAGAVATLASFTVHGMHLSWVAVPFLIVITFVWQLGLIGVRTRILQATSIIVNDRAVCGRMYATDSASLRHETTLDREDIAKVHEDAWGLHIVGAEQRGTIEVPAGLPSYAALRERLEQWCPIKRQTRRREITIVSVLVIACGAVPLISLATGAAIATSRGIGTIGLMMVMPIIVTVIATVHRRPHWGAPPQPHSSESLFSRHPAHYTTLAAMLLFVVCALLFKTW